MVLLLLFELDNLVKNWKTLSTELVFSAPPYLEVTKQKVEIDQGRVIDDFYQVHLRPFVVIVPVLENGNVQTIQQYKHGPGRVSLTFPAGFIEDLEKPADACRRELLEETGLHAGKLIHLGEFVDNGNQLGCTGTYYLGLGCRQVAEPDAGDLEEMLLCESTYADLDNAVQDGEIAIIHHAAAWSLARLRHLSDQ